MSVDPLAEKFAAWSPYTYTLDNPVRLVDRDGMEAEDEWEIIINKDGTSSTRWISDRGGDKTDYIRTRNGIPIPQDGAIDYTYEVAVKSIATTSSSELPRGEIDKGPGYRVYDVGPGGAIESVYNDVALGFMPLPKLGLLGKLKGALGFGAKEVVEGAAEGGAKLWPAASKGRTAINGIEYTTHALERMQPVGTIMKGTKVFSRGVPPSVVENAIKFGKVTPGNTALEVIRTFENVRVITNPQGTRVISVIKMSH